MKTKLFILFAIVIAMSCSSPELIDKASDTKAIQLSNVSSSSLASVNSWLQQNGAPTFKNSDGSIINFNFNSLMRSSTKLSEVSSLFATEIGYNKSSKQSVTVTFNELNGKILNVMFVRLTDNYNGTKTAEYFDSSNSLLTTALISSVKQSVTFTKSPNLKVNAKGCGQAVADCMDDAYTKAGWGSVLLTLTSVIEPWTIVGVVAAGCALQNC